MPGLVYPVPELEESIVRPVLFQVLGALNETLNFDPKTKILFKGEGLQIPNRNQTTSGRGSYLPELGQGNKLEVELEETYMEDAILSQAVDNRSLKPLLKDKKGGWVVRDIHAQAECRLSLVYRTSDRTEADKFRSHVYTRLSRGFTQTITNCNIEFPINESLLATLMEIWKNRVELTSSLYPDKPKQPFLEYLEECKKHNFNIKTTLTGKHKTLVFRRTIGNVAITLDTKEIAKPTEPDQQGVYRVSLSVYYHYDKPINYFIKYPIFTYNKILNPKYFDVNLDRNKVDKIPTEHSSCFLSMWDSYLNGRNTSLRGYPGVYIPGCDDWVGEITTDPSSVMVIQWLLAVDLNDPHLIYDLKTLANDGLEVNPKLLNYFSKFRTEFFTPTKLPLYFAFFGGIHELTGTDFYIDENLCIRSIKGLDPEVIYHLQFKMQLNLDLLPDDVIEEMANEDSLIIDVCRAIDSKTVEDHAPEIKPDGSVWVGDVNSIIADLPTLPYYKGKTGHVMFTVNTIAVLAVNK